MVHRRNARAGFTLMEMALVMAVGAILLAAVAPVAARQVEMQLAQRVGREVALVEDAAKWFYVDQKRWPTGIAELGAGGYLNAAWNGQTPWGDVYGTSSSPAGFSVTVGVPLGLEGVLTSVIATPSVSIVGDRAVVASLVPVPGREAANAMLVKRKYSRFPVW